MATTTRKSRPQSSAKACKFSKTEAYKELVQECQRNKSLYKGYSKHRSYAALKQFMDECVDLPEYSTHSDASVVEYETDTTTTVAEYHEEPVSETYYDSMTEEDIRTHEGTTTWSGEPVPQLVHYPGWTQQHDNQSDSHQSVDARTIEPAEKLPENPEVSEPLQISAAKENVGKSNNYQPPTTMLNRIKREWSHATASTCKFLHLQGASAARCAFSFGLGFMDGLKAK